MDHILFQILDYFKYIIKNHQRLPDKPPLRIYFNKTENKIKNKIIRDKHVELVPRLEITKVVLIHCSIINNDYHYDLRALYTFVPNNPSHELLDISPKVFIILTFNSIFLYIELCFTDNSSKLPEAEDKINMNLIIDWSVTCKKLCAIQLNLEIVDSWKDMDFCILLKTGKCIGKSVSKNLNGKYSLRLFNKLNKHQQMYLKLLRKKLVYDNIMEKSQMLVQQILKHSNLRQKQQEEPLLMVIQICWNSWVIKIVK